MILELKPLPTPLRSKRMLVAGQLGMLLCYALAAALLACMYALPIQMDHKVLTAPLHF